MYLWESRDDLKSENNIFVATFVGLAINKFMISSINAGSIIGFSKFLTTVSIVSSFRFKFYSIFQIYISSRTHSQLSQFIGEIKRTVFKEDTRVVTLASRQHYCINSEVVKLKNVNLINER